VLELVGLERRFGEIAALDGLGFAVARGEVCGFLGPNGAGKTTAMRAVVGVTRLDAGEVRWDGRPIDRGVRRRTGYLPEERGLYPKMRVAEQLTYLGRLHGLEHDEARRRTSALLEELGLEARAADDTEALSLGNQQRVQLAAALVHEPELLILDEPFSGLDPLAVDTMSTMLRARADRGAAVVFSSHQLDLVEDLCRTVAVVAEGRTVLAGSVTQLRAAGERRLRVGIDGPAAWVANVPPGDWKLRVAPTGPDDEAVFILGAETDPDVVLDVARAAGPLTRLSLERPRLSELFRDAVGPGGAR
jgi:ABC-2 type transport system ATP-binding protein